MRVLLLAVAISLCGCTALNVRAYQDASCRSDKAGLEPWHKEAADSEALRKSPNGWVTQPYSRENWDKYWNDVIYYVWTVGPTDCNGSYTGPYGPEIVGAVIDYRRRLGLPEINLDERNLNKGL